MNETIVTNQARELLFSIKICGVKLIEDVLAVEAASADAIGLNFFPPSVRYLNPDEPTTTELSRVAESCQLKRVGVFVNESTRRIDAILGAVGLDAIQFHGDESPDEARAFLDQGVPVLRAIKLPAREPGSSSDRATGPSLTSESERDFLQRLDRQVAPWVDAGCAILLDADAGAAHGGSGKTLPWDLIRTWADRNPDLPWTLAGGLTPENVALAIQLSGATSVDTASGVESPKGTKSKDRIAAFASNASQAIADQN